MRLYFYAMLALFLVMLALLLSSCQSYQPPGQGVWLTVPRQ